MRSKNCAWLLLFAVLGVTMAWAARAHAVSPYDRPYGIQWNFIIGQDAADNPNAVAMSPDGTIWIATMGTGKTSSVPMLTWGSDTGVYGGHYASGYGQVSRLGGIIQGNDIPNVTGLTGYSQGYGTAVRFAGNDPTAYVATKPNSLALWTDANPPDTTSGKTHPLTFAVPSGLGQPGFEPYYDYVNGPGDPLDPVMPRKHDPLDPTKKFTHDLVSPDAYGGSAFDFAMGSDGSYYFALAAQVGAGNPASMGDTFTPGDFSGPVGQSYKPAVGRISADGLTRYGPAHQPACNGRSFFTDIDINEAAVGGAGRVYVTGYGYTGSGGTMDMFDPDGPGTDFAPIAFDPTTPSGSQKGFALVYNATTWGIDKVVTWESTQGYDVPTDITATPSGGFVLAGITRGDLGGTNPAPGTNDGYVEVYNPDGTLAWSYQTQTAVDDSFGDVTVDADGNIYISGNRNNGADNDPFLMKFKPDGTIVWTTTIDNGGTVESQRDHDGDKYGMFLLSEYNPSAGGTPWTNTLAYVPQGSDEVLLQKLVPGDANGDGFVDDTDKNLIQAAVSTPLIGDDTWDFDGDGNSTSADYDFFLHNILNLPLPGDFNVDGQVEQNDLNLLLVNWGSTTVPAEWVAPFDGLVDQNELNDLLVNWGAGVGAEAVGGESAVPEPATLGLLLLGGLAIRRRR